MPSDIYQGFVFGIVVVLHVCFSLFLADVVTHLYQKLCILISTTTLKYWLIIHQVFIGIYRVCMWLKCWARIGLHPHELLMNVYQKPTKKTVTPMICVSPTHWKQVNTNNNYTDNSCMHWWILWCIQVPRSEAQQSGISILINRLI